MFGENPKLVQVAPMLLYRTLGPTLPDGAAAAAPLYAGCQQTATEHTVAVQRALETDLTPPLLGDALFEKMLASRSGFVFTAHEYDEIFQLVKHPDGKIHLAVPELLEWLERLDPAAEQDDPAFPFTLVAGQRRMHNANQIFRNPAWRKSDPDGALRIHPDDVAALGATDGGWMAVSTRTGRIVCRVESDRSFNVGVGVFKAHAALLPAGIDELGDGKRPWYAGECFRNQLGLARQVQGDVHHGFDIVR